jgi:hypothetical protein
MRKILLAIAVFVVLLCVWLFYKPQESTVSADIPPAFKALLDAKLDQATKLKIEKGKGPAVELTRAGDKWVVSTAYGYPADGEKIDKILKALDGIEKGEKRGSAEAAQEEYKTDLKQGAVITAYAADQKEIARVVVGDTARSKNFSRNFVYLRFGDDPTTFEVESDIRNAASLYAKIEPKSYLLKKVLAFGDDLEAQSVRLTRPDKPDVVVERKSREVPVEKPQETPPAAAGEEAKEEEKKEEEKKPETKKEEYFVVTSGPETKAVGKDEEWQARSLVNKVKDFTIDDGVEPKDLAEYGLDKPQLKATVTYRKKDKPDDELKTVTFLFGNAKKDDKGNTSGYYTVIEAGDEHKGRVYLVPQYAFDGWNKELKDFQPKPKEEPKPAAPAPAPPATPGAPGAPGEAPAATPVAPGAAAAPAPVPSAPSPPPAAVPPPAGTPAPGSPPATGAAAPEPAPTPPPAPPAPPAEARKE